MAATTKAPEIRIPHEDFCADPDPRIESYPAVRGEGPTARAVTITRCIECGGQRIDEQEKANG
jgi:hypothetical protein